MLFIALLTLVLPTWATAEAGVGSDVIRLGTTSPFTGGLKEWGDEYKRGADAFVRNLNAQGGINGRKLEIVYLDDGYDPKRTVENVKVLVEQKDVFALINLCGTPNTEAVLPYLESRKIPTIGTASGSHTVRAPLAPSRYLFHTRAGYAEETEAIVEYLATVGISRIAVVHQNNGLGLAGLSLTQAALKRRNLAALAVAAVETNSADVETAVQTILKTAPAVVVMITAGKVSVDFIRHYRRAGGNTQFFGINVIGTKLLVEQLGPDARGIMVSQVVPYPRAGTKRIVREFQSLMEKTGTGDYSFVTLEGYINAKLAAMALKKAGLDPTREKFVNALESEPEFDLGDFVLKYRPGNHNGSKTVELTIIGADQRFVR
ncbi:MAG TPA: ABC transporter substrate-binding protein [Lysobacter sp.]|nr:ABC transporter substrate-binding protein [Lysobacter sp.]